MERARLAKLTLASAVIVAVPVAAVCYRSRASAPSAPLVPARGLALGPALGGPRAAQLCPRCGTAVGLAVTCPRCGAPLAPALRTALAAPSIGRGGSLPTPLEQNAASKEFIEGHWLGLEVIPLTPELAAEYRIPKGESGVLVDEITLESAESGILAGDMVHAIGGVLTRDLREFFVATQRVRRERSAQVEVHRRGRPMTFTMTARNFTELGFAQMEAAQPIRPGSISPHRTRSQACTGCHIIMSSGGQLPTDAGDIVPTPGAIRPDAVAPHRYRGECSSCHLKAR